ncbi:protein of unknown function [Flavobacterium glycines]|uniref:DUF4349 domain-containing protein n=2 Tax=Flavobacterium glycines TaxID=551990 RepID=A0A1B9DP45_9FLAO|nr:DUF4349 domain-containing protein [Flavobacterium glycines]OCB71445.1 hypothetical protein FBGL_09380 [Flavobacterium glycines]SDI66920.1 protein of unknown function [Flavobacterium glycines]
MKNLFLFLIILVFSSSCKKSDDFGKDKMMSVNEVGTVLLPPPPPKVDEVKFVKPVIAKSEENIEQKIIKTGDIRFESNDLEETYSQIIAAVKKHHAVIQNDTEGKDNNSVFRRLAVRVPSKNFDLFLDDISKGVTYFDNKEISSQDVTEEYIDVDARLKAKKVLEARYLELLKKANKVSEMLEIEAQLSTIREEIEAKEGQLRYMQSQVSMSTITIEFYKTVANEGGATISYVSKIWNAIKSGFNEISNFFIVLLSIWPFLIILAVILHFIRKRFKKKIQ